MKILVCCETIKDFLFVTAKKGETAVMSRRVMFEVNVKLRLKWLCQRQDVFWVINFVLRKENVKLVRTETSGRVGSG